MGKSKEYYRQAQEKLDMANQAKLKEITGKNQLKDIVKIIGVDALGLLATAIVGTLDPFLQANANIDLACLHPLYTLFGIGFLAYNILAISSVGKY